MNYMTPQGDIVDTDELVEITKLNNYGIIYKHKDKYEYYWGHPTIYNSGFFGLVRYKMFDLELNSMTEMKALSIALDLGMSYEVVKKLFDAERLRDEYYAEEE